MSDALHIEKLKLALATLDEAAACAESALPHHIKSELKAARRSLSTVSICRMIANANMDNTEAQILALIADFRNGWRALEGDISAQDRPVDLTLGQHRQR